MRLRVIESTDHQHVGMVLEIQDGQEDIILGSDESVRIDILSAQADGTVKVGNANYIMVCVNG